MALRQSVDVELLLATMDDLISFALSLSGRVAYCEMFHDDDDDNDDDDDDEDEEHT